MLPAVLFVVALSIATLAIYRLLTKYHNYWKERGVAHEKPNAIFGNFADRILLRTSFFDFDRDVYRRFPNEKLHGYYEFRNPVLWIRDPDLIRHVLVKDFDHFVDHREFQMHNKYFDEMVMNKKGEEWKRARNVITPTFTSGKLKRTFGCATSAAHEMCRFLKEKNKDPIEVKDVFGRFSMEVIASTAFAVDSHCFRDSKPVFTQMAGKIMSPSGWRIFIFLLSIVFPELTHWIPLSFVDEEAINFFVNVVKATIEHRRKKDVEGNDFLQLLLDAQKGKFAENDQVADGKPVLTDDQVIANAVIFFIAGYETTATTLAFAVYELARNPDIQDKLLEEIRSVLANNNDDITYEAVQQMNYLDMVFSETLRKYPPSNRLERRCTENYDVLGSDVLIEKDTIVAISVSGIHHDPRYYPDPERFDPERFTPEAKQTRHPYVYLPFGHGPRNCIGMRFAQMETKVALVKLLLDFQFNVCSKTDIPLTFHKSSMALCAQNGIWLQLQERTTAALKTTYN